MRDAFEVDGLGGAEGGGISGSHLANANTVSIFLLHPPLVSIPTCSRNNRPTKAISPRPQDSQLAGLV